MHGNSDEENPDNSEDGDDAFEVFFNKDDIAEIQKMQEKDTFKEILLMKQNSKVSETRIDIKFHTTIKENSAEKEKGKKKRR